MLFRSNDPREQSAPSEQDNSSFGQHSTPSRQDTTPSGQDTTPTVQDSSEIFPTDFSSFDPFED